MVTKTQVTSRKLRAALAGTCWRSCMLVFSFGLAMSSSVLLAQDESIDVLPELPERLQTPDRLSDVDTVFVSAFEFDGNTVYSDAELQSFVSAYTGREISAEELQEVRELIGRRYLEDGYINSGALIPDQTISEGVITLQIVEGKLSDVLIRGDPRIRDDYIIGRLTPGDPLNIPELERKIQLLQRDPLIKRLDAQVSPGARHGEAELIVEVEEDRPYWWRVRFNNHRNPNIGEEQLQINAGHHNLLGYGDRLSVEFSKTDGLRDVELYYTMPATRSDSSITFQYEYSDSSVVAKPFDALDIESEFEHVGGEVRHALVRSLTNEVALTLELAHRETQTFLLGQPFSFSDGAVDGEISITRLGFGQEWIHSSPGRILALRSTFYFGLDWFDATTRGTRPDGRFTYWLAQGQWIRGLDFLDSRLVVRADTQLSNRPLFGSEKFSLGGYETVRGYRESLLNRDNAVFGSIELQIPIAEWRIPGISTGKDDGQLRIAPFFDYGRGWDESRVTPDPEDISSVGASLLYSPSDWINASVTYGYALRNIDRENEELQDDGIQFDIEIRLF